MILYSIVPVETVFTNLKPDNEYIEMDYLGERVQAIPLENNQYMLNRVISTSLKAYLNPKLQPGTIIKGSF